MSTSKCAVRQTEYNQLARDLQAKQNELDSCDPSSAEARRNRDLAEKAHSYQQEKIPMLNDLNDQMERNTVTIKSMLDVQATLKDYSKTLDTELAELRTASSAYTQEERKHRRHFLDSAPQDGASSLTYDDKILLVFWVGFALTVGVVLLTVIRMYAAQIGSVYEQTFVGVAAFALVVAIARYFVAQYA
jgi:hypothetical protein